MNAESVSLQVTRELAQGCVDYGRQLVERLDESNVHDIMDDVKAGVEFLLIANKRLSPPDATPSLN